MSPAVKVPLPSGTLGVTFKGKVATVVSVAEDSPMRGRVKPGYVVDTLYLADGTEYSDLSAKELLQTLGDYKDEEGRKMKLRLALPESATIPLEPGYVGLTIEGNPPLIVKIQDPKLKEIIRPGPAVVTLSLADGTEYTGHSAEEIFELLAENEDAEGRSLTIKDPETMGTITKSVTLPDMKEVPLPSGSLGAFFQGTPVKITKMREDSPMRGIFRLGMVVDELRLPNGTEYAGLDTEDLVKALSDSAESEGRVMILKKPTSKKLAKKSTTKVVLPKGELGLSFTGKQATIDDVAEDSPFFDMLYAGQVVDVLCLPDGMEYDEVDANDVSEVLDSSADVEGRYMILENCAPVVKMPDEIEVILPPGKLGLSFKGEPPVISKISETSPLKDEVMEGLVVDTLTLANGAKLMELGTQDLVKFLSESADTEGRVMVLKNPETAEMTELPDSIEVALPTGKLGTVFSGTPPTVTRFNEGSPMADKFIIGLAVDMLTLADGTVLTGLTLKELITTLNETGDTEGRTMLLKNPKTSVMSKKQVLLPDELSVNLPSGSLGVSFKGPTAKITRIQENSVMKGKFRVGMVVDVLILPDGSTYSGLTSKEMVQILVGSSILEGRRAVLRNPETTELSGKSVERKAGPKLIEDDSYDDKSQRI